MTTYITKTDKKGRDIYYAVTDGKMKKISRAEYEAHLVETETVETEAVETEAVETEAVEAEAVETEAVETEAVETEAVETESSQPVEGVTFDFVKAVVEATESKHAKKMYMKVSKNCATINYRNCLICSLVFGKDKNVKAIRFMGTTAETRKTAVNHEFHGASELNTYREEIIKQVAFIDEWYMLNSKKTKKAA